MELRVGQMARRKLSISIQTFSEIREDYFRLVLSSPILLSA